MSSSLDHKCQRCGSQFHGQVCPFCTISGLDVNALLASEGIGLQAAKEEAAAPPATAATKAGQTVIIDLSSHKEYPVTPPVCRFGRDISNDIVLTGDKSLSRFHFQITCTNDEFLIEDAGSRNGTFLNGSPCSAPRKILNGDIISAGMSRYRFVIGNESSGTSKNGDGNHAAGQDKPAAEPVKEAPKAAAPPATQADSQIQPKASDSQAKAKESGSQAEKKESVDPLKRLFEEGQALLNKAPIPSPAAAEEEASVDKLLPGKEDELGDTASRFLKLASRNPLDQLFPAGSEPVRADAKPQQGQDWPKWCVDFSFPELGEISSKANQLAEQIAVKQAELEQLRKQIAEIETQKNRLLAARDDDMVQACADVFSKLGWSVKPNGSNKSELVLFAEDKAVAIARVVSTDGQPKPSEIANLVGSLSTYWCDHGVEPKGILVIAFALDAPPQSRPELTPDFAQYAAKKNLCLMNSLQLLSIFRSIAFKKSDVEQIKSELLNASGQLSGFEINS